MTDVIELPRTELKMFHIPKIFANGKDDDSVGLAAAFKNEAVEYDGKVYKPDEDIAIDGRPLLVSMRFILRGSNGAEIDPIEEMKQGPFIFIRISPEWSRHIELSNCCIEFKRTPEWPHDTPNFLDVDDIEITHENNTCSG